MSPYTPKTLCGGRPKKNTRTRFFPDWLTAFLLYTEHGEAPKSFYFWVGVSTIAAALRRQVWIDQYYYRWFPNLYTIFVAPPAIVSKSSTIEKGMELLRNIKEVPCGPDIVTWQALLGALAEVKRNFKVGGKLHTQSALYIASSELGNFFNPQDREMVDLLITLWDSPDKPFSKRTKHCGTDQIISPCLNLIGATTPSWLSGNVPQHLIGGGFTSRCLFVFADRKEKLIAYPGRDIPKDLEDIKHQLISDLKRISNLSGEMVLTAEALDWGENWYKQHNTVQNILLEGSHFEGYLARRQTQLHKVAMILSVSSGDFPNITEENLATADAMLITLEHDLPSVFSGFGRPEIMQQVDRFRTFIEASPEGVRYDVAYRYVHSQFPSLRRFEDIVLGLVRAGFIKITKIDDTVMLFPIIGA